MIRNTVKKRVLMPKIYASIVLYHNPRGQLEKAIKSFLNTSLDVKLYLIDNSSEDTLKDFQNIDSRIEYIFNGANFGYGKAHNIAIRESIEKNVPYHLVLNPDVYFDAGVLESLYEYMEKSREIGNMMPRVVYPNGDVQYLCKLLPTPIDLILRRFVPFESWKKSIMSDMKCILVGTIK